MKRKNSAGWITIMTAVICMVCISCVYAAEKQQPQRPEQKQENGVVKFFRGVFTWPFTITKNAGQTVARTTETGVTTVANTGTSAVETVTGKPEKIKDVVVVPVKGSAETGYVAVEGAVKSPVKGAKEAFE